MDCPAAACTHPVPGRYAERLLLMVESRTVDYATLRLSAAVNKALFIPTESFAA